MPTKRVTLSSKEEMLERLLKVSTDISYQSTFYPKLLDHAEKDFSMTGIILLLRIVSKSYGEALTEAINSHMLEYIDALILDESIAEETKKLFTELMAISSEFNSKLSSRLPQTKV